MLTSQDKKEQFPELPFGIQGQKITQSLLFENILNIHIKEPLTLDLPMKQFLNLFMNT